MDRRELLKSSLMTCGVAFANRAFGSWLAPHALADGTAPTDPIVKTRLGSLRGTYANGVYSFKGVQYGASTAGAMRFMAPSLATPWTGVRDALEFGSPPAQDRNWALMSTELREFLGDLIPPGTMTEDCLLLNLWRQVSAPQASAR